MTGAAHAGFARRLAALVYDTLLIAALLMVFTAVSLIFTHGEAVLPQTAGPWVHVYRAGLIGVIAGYFVLNWVRSGQTLGMRAWHLRAVADSGRPMRLQAAAGGEGQRRAEAQGSSRPLERWCR